MPQAISFSPDSRLLVASSTDQTTNLLDVRARKRVGESFPVEEGAIPVARFTPDGEMVVDYLLRAAKWRMDLKSWKRFACEAAGRDLSPGEWADVLPDRPYRRTCPS